MKACLGFQSSLGLGPWPLYGRHLSSPVHYRMCWFSLMDGCVDLQRSLGLLPFRLHVSCILISAHRNMGRLLPDEGTLGPLAPAGASSRCLYATSSLSFPLTKSGLRHELTLRIRPCSPKIISCLSFHWRWVMSYNLPCSAAKSQLWGKYFCACSSCGTIIFFNTFHWMRTVYTSRSRIQCIFAPYGADTVSVQDLEIKISCFKPSLLKIRSWNPLFCLEGTKCSFCNARKYTSIMEGVVSFVQVYIGIVDDKTYAGLVYTSAVDWTLYLPIVHCYLLEYSFL